MRKWFLMYVQESTAIVAILSIKIASLGDAGSAALARPTLLALHGDPPSTNGLEQRLVIAFVLLRVGDGKSARRLRSKRALRAEDTRRSSRELPESRVRARQRPPAGAWLAR